MKKFNASLFALFAILLNAATTNAWEWPWNKYKWQASTTQSWKEYGTQKGKAILLGINNHRKTALAVGIGIGGLALAYKYGGQARQFFSKTDHLIIKESIKYYNELISRKTLTEVEINLKISSIKALVDKYNTYKSIKNRNDIQEKSFQLLETWYNQYNQNTPQ